MTNLYVYQGIEKAKMYVGHTRMNSETGKLLAIKKSYLELESGRGKFPLAHPEVCLDPWIPRMWVSTLGIFMHKCDGSRQKIRGSSFFNATMTVSLWTLSESGLRQNVN